MNIDNPVTLIQLISEQTMQNLLPILRFRPARVVHLCTSKTASRSAHIAKAAQCCNTSFELEQVRLSAMPSIKETVGAVKTAIDAARAAHNTPLVNFTGGTKLMSIGAYWAAKSSTPPVVSFYVDTEDEKFVDGQTAEGLGTLLAGDTSFAQLHRFLNVPTIAAANGQDLASPGRDWRPFLTLARYLFEHPSEEQATFEAIYGPNGLCPNAQAPNSPEKWLKLLDKPFALPRAVADLVTRINLVRPTTNGLCQLPDTTRNQLTDLVRSRRENMSSENYETQRIAAIEPLQFSLAFLTGGWWEVIVADMAQSSGLFRDVRWNVITGNQPTNSLEEDILAVEGVQIVHISCKRGGNRARLLPHLYEFDARARNIGGTFTRRFLALYLQPTPNAMKNLRRRAAQLGIVVLTASDIAQPRFHQFHKA